mmetsp:Transcript_48767/g.114508  ORF Transcript_48767/g.114508 Transcript_48767/m.114508 type:complete len:209 (-) Transcript_48767:160-786(-)
MRPRHDLFGFEHLGGLCHATLRDLKQLGLGALGLLQALQDLHQLLESGLGEQACFVEVQEGDRQGQQRGQTEVFQEAQAMQQHHQRQPVYKHGQQCLRQEHVAADTEPGEMLEPRFLPSQDLKAGHAGSKQWESGQPKPTHLSYKRGKTFVRLRIFCCCCKHRSNQGHPLTVAQLRVLHQMLQDHTADPSNAGLERGVATSRAGKVKI